MLVTDFTKALLETKYLVCLAGPAEVLPVPTWKVLLLKETAGQKECNY